MKKRTLAEAVEEGNLYLVAWESGLAHGEAVFPGAESVPEAVTFARMRFALKPSVPLRVYRVLNARGTVVEEVRRES